MESGVLLHVKRPKRVLNFTAHLVLAAMMLVNTQLPYWPPLMITAWWVFAVLALGLSVYYLVRLIEKRPSLELLEDAILLNGSRIEADELAEVRTRGYFLQVFALLSKGRRMVAYDRCFSFAREDLQGMQALRAWAERNQVPIADGKRIVTWI
ncbi:hypothetical protein PA598K_02966 [Paenibacillus sp. 598K]|uniref:hypothetical protein n=1 Tax=Paenibacillus sp. 598K TaxID=1117987 RepID=UPI000FF93B27|nr:hypothetical protein [Paenibacillus sp. 598K]GBF74609.1 hypothetical protein PA598K_02966 [Paenibacillus sp. 598K]